MTPMNTDVAHASEAVAVEAERRWAIIVMLIIAMLLAMMVFTGLHWAAMPPSRVETIDPRKLHIAGEFVEDNLGTTLGADGKVTVRLIAQQYSFEPQCLVVPAGMPVTFRTTSTDAVHGFVVDKTGERLMPCHEYCGTGHAAMWGRVQVMPAEEFLAKAKGAERMHCVPR